MQVVANDTIERSSSSSGSNREFHRGVAYLLLQDRSFVENDVSKRNRFKPFLHFFFLVFLFLFMAEFGCSASELFVRNKDRCLVGNDISKCRFFEREEIKMLLENRLSLCENRRFVENDIFARLIRS